MLSGHLINRHSPGAALTQPPFAINELTQAERRVLRLIAAGKLNDEIAVEHHRSNICSKLGLNGKHALLTFALTHKSEI